MIDQSYKKFTDSVVYALSKESTSTKKSRSGIKGEEVLKQITASQQDLLKNMDKETNFIDISEQVKLTPRDIEDITYTLSAKELEMIGVDYYIEPDNQNFRLFIPTKVTETKTKTTTNSAGKTVNEKVTVTRTTRQKFTLGVVKEITYDEQNGEQLWRAKKIKPALKSLTLAITMPNNILKFLKDSQYLISPPLELTTVPILNSKSAQYLDKEQTKLLSYFLQQVHNRRVQKVNELITIKKDFQAKNTIIEEQQEVKQLSPVPAIIPTILDEKHNLQGLQEELPADIVNKVLDYTSINLFSQDSAMSRGKSILQTVMSFSGCELDSPQFSQLAKNLTSIYGDQNILRSFVKTMNKYVQVEQGEEVICDLTTYRSDAKNIAESALGKESGKDSLSNVVKLKLVHLPSTGQIIDADVLPGNTSDSSTLIRTIESMHSNKFTNVIYKGDRAFDSLENFAYLQKKHEHYIIMMKGERVAEKQIIKENLQRLQDIYTIDPTTKLHICEVIKTNYELGFCNLEGEVKLNNKTKEVEIPRKIDPHKENKIVLLYDPVQSNMIIDNTVIDALNLIAALNDPASKLKFKPTDNKYVFFSEKTGKYEVDFGKVSALIYNHVQLIITDKIDLSAQEIYIKYRERSIIENDFGDKTENRAESMRVHNSATLQLKFIIKILMCTVKNEMNMRLREYSLKKGKTYSLRNILMESTIDKIETNFNSIARAQYYANAKSKRLYEILGIPYRDSFDYVQKVNQMFIERRSFKNKKSQYENAYTVSDMNLKKIFPRDKKNLH